MLHFPGAGVGLNAVAAQLTVMSLAPSAARPRGHACASKAVANIEHMYNVPRRAEVNVIYLLIVGDETQRGI